jgi:histidine ammonia-lyase
VERAHAVVRARVAPLAGDREPAPDLEAIHALLREGAFTPARLGLPT